MSKIKVDKRHLGACRLVFFLLSYNERIKSSYILSNNLFAPDFCVWLFNTLRFKNVFIQNS